MPTKVSAVRPARASTGQRRRNPARNRPSRAGPVCLAAGRVVVGRAAAGDRTPRVDSDGRFILLRSAANGPQ
jgi:hypothetical protein